MYAFTFECDENFELKKMQQLMYQDLGQTWDIFNGAKAILICSCLVIDTDESRKLADFTKTITTYDHRIFLSTYGILAAMYRYQFGMEKDDEELRKEFCDSYIEYYKSLKSFPLYFQNKDPEKWYHFLKFKRYFKQKCEHLLKYRSFVNSVNFNTILRHQSEQQYLQDQLITEAILKIFNIELFDIELDFSNLGYASDPPWNEYVHPYFDRFDPDYLFRN